MDRLPEKGDYIRITLERHTGQILGLGDVFPVVRIEDHWNGKLITVKMTENQGHGLYDGQWEWPSPCGGCGDWANHNDYLCQRCRDGDL